MRVPSKPRSLTEVMTDSAFLDLSGPARQRVIGQWTEAARKYGKFRYGNKFNDAELINGMRAANAFAQETAPVEGVQRPGYEDAARQVRGNLQDLVSRMTPGRDVEGLPPVSFGFAQHATQPQAPAPGGVAAPPAPTLTPEDTQAQYRFQGGGLQERRTDTTVPLQPSSPASTEEGPLDQLNRMNREPLSLGGFSPQTRETLLKTRERQLRGDSVSRSPFGSRVLDARKMGTARAAAGLVNVVPLAVDTLVPPPTPAFTEKFPRLAATLEKIRESSTKDLREGAEQWRQIADYHVKNEQLKDIGTLSLMRQRRYADAGQRLVLSLSEQIPQLVSSIAATAAGGPQAAIAVLGSRAAGEKYQELSADDSLSQQQRVVGAITVGAIEAVTERFGSIVNIEKFITGPQAGQLFTKGVKSAVKELGWASGRGAVEEGTARLGENIVDILLKRKPASSLVEGVDEEALVGGVMELLTAGLGGMTRTESVQPNIRPYAEIDAFIARKEAEARAPRTEPTADIETDVAPTAEVPTVDEKLSGVTEESTELDRQQTAQATEPPVSPRQELEAAPGAEGAVHAAQEAAPAPPAGKPPELMTPEEHKATAAAYQEAVKEIPLSRLPHPTESRRRMESAIRQAEGLAKANPKAAWKVDEARHDLELFDIQTDAWLKDNMRLRQEWERTAGKEFVPYMDDPGATASSRALFGEHQSLVREATQLNRPVSAAAVDAYGIKLPEGYTRSGDRYVFKAEQPPPPASSRDRAALIAEATRKGLIEGNEEQAELATMPIEQLRALVRGDDVDVEVSDEYQPTAQDLAELEKSNVEARNMYANQRDEWTAPPIDLSVEKTRPVSASEVIARHARMFNLPVRRGRTRGYPGLYKKLSRVVRMSTQKARSLAVFSHEVAHHIDNTNNAVNAAPFNVKQELATKDYEFPKKKRMSEGFAEYVRHMITNDDAAEFAPRTHEWMKNTFLPAHPDVASRLSSLKKETTAYRAQTAEQEAESVIKKTDKPTDMRGRMDRVTEATRGLATAMEDRFDPVHRFMEEVHRQKHVERGRDPYVWARVFYRKEGSLAEDAWRNGVKSLVTGRRMSEGLDHIIRRMNVRSLQEFDQFTRFMFARHAIDVWNKNKNPGISKLAAEAIYEKYKNMPGWIAGANAITAWNKSHVDMLLESNGLDKETAERIKLAWPTYIPLRRVRSRFARARSGKDYADTSAPIKSRHGSDLDVIDPWTSMMMMSQEMYHAAIVNRIMDMIAEHADPEIGGLEGMGEFVERIPTPMNKAVVKLENIAKELEAAGVDLSDADMTTLLNIWRPNMKHGSEPIVFRYENGKLVAYQFNRDFYNALANFSDMPMPGWTNMILKPAMTMTQMKRMGATGLRASFGMVANPFRDIPEQMIKTEGRSLAVLPNFIGNVIGVAYNHWATARGEIADPITELFRAFGGELSGFIGQDLEAGYKRTRELVNNITGKRWRNVVFHPIETIQTGLAMAESAPRIGEMQETLRKHDYTAKDLADGKVPMDVQVEAMFNANEATTDFMKRGYVAGFVNRVKAFFNVSIQGPAQTLRKSGLDPREWSPARQRRTMFRGITYYTIPTLAYWALIKDEDWYKELHPYRKTWCWNFRVGDKTFSFPRGFLYAFVFSVLPEAILNKAYNDDPGAVNETFAELLKSEGFGMDSVLPDILQLPLELETNYQFWQERALEPEYIQKTREPRDRFADYNTAASRYVGNILNMSPTKLDYIIYSITGGLGTDILRIPEEGPVRALGFNRFTRPMDRGRSINDFYEERTRLRQKVGSQKLHNNVNEQDAKRLKMMESVSRQISTLRDKKDSARDNKALTAKYNKQTTGLARKALGRKPLAEYPVPTQTR